MLALNAYVPEHLLHFKVCYTTKINDITAMTHAQL
jgi:hypothetical protein